MNVHTHEGANALEVYIDTDETRTSTLSRHVYNTVQVNASWAGGDDNRGAGLYALTLWHKTDAADVKSVPGALYGFTDMNFRNIGFTDTGYAGAPLGPDAWEKVTVSLERLHGARFQIFVILRADLWLAQDSAATQRVYWEPLDFGSNPGYESDAKVYIDDVQIHKVTDDATYFDRSVFPVE